MLIKLYKGSNGSDCWAWVWTSCHLKCVWFPFKTKIRLMKCNGRVHPIIVLKMYGLDLREWEWTWLIYWKSLCRSVAGQDLIPHLSCTSWRLWHCMCSVLLAVNMLVCVLKWFFSFFTVKFLEVIKPFCVILPEIQKPERKVWICLRILLVQQYVSELLLRGGIKRPLNMVFKKMMSVCADVLLSPVHWMNV